MLFYLHNPLKPTQEERYSTIEKECLAIKLGIHAFKVYLLGRSFQVQTDHRALVWLNSVKDKTSRLTRSIALQPFDFTIVHWVGRANANADALSRIPSSSTSHWRRKEECGGQKFL